MLDGHEWQSVELPTLRLVGRLRRRAPASHQRQRLDGPELRPLPVAQNPALLQVPRRLHSHGLHPP